MKQLTLALYAFGITFQIHAQGYIVPNGITSVGNDTIQVIQNPNNLDYTGFMLLTQTVNTFTFASFADEGVRGFLVNPNDPISQQTISAHAYTELVYPTVYTFNNGTSFYLGLYTGYGYTGTYTDPLFGWAQLKNVNGTIQLLGSGLEYGGGGIYAGTQNIIAAVPEPETYALILFGAAGLFGFKRVREKKLT